MNHALPDAPRMPLPTLADLDDHAVCEERALAYANMASAYHQMCLRMEWELARSNAELALLRQDVLSLSVSIENVCRTLRDLSAAMGAK